MLGLLLIVADELIYDLNRDDDRNEDYVFLILPWRPSNILKLLSPQHLGEEFQTVSTLAPTLLPCVSEVTYLERG
jgi:hypothetical protein